MITLPMTPERPSPAVTETDPPAPPTAEPDATETAPVLPSEVLPETKSTDPLDSTAFPVPITTRPLVDASAEPIET